MSNNIWVDEVGHSLVKYIYILLFHIFITNLVHVTNHTASQHLWKIYVTDILDSEAGIVFIKPERRVRKGRMPIVCRKSSGARLVMKYM